MKDQYYCGPFWLPTFVKKILSAHFNHACSIHDREYGMSIPPRKDVDDRFLENMELERASRKKKHTRLMYAFYYAVRIFGWTSWYLIKIMRFIKRK